MLAKAGATQVIFDKDRGLEILVRALGGAYAPLKFGQPTGFNPLALARLADAAGVPAGVAARAGRASGLGTHGAGGSGSRAGAARHAGARAASSRRLSRLIEFLDSTDAEGMYARLVALVCGV